MLHEFIIIQYLLTQIKRSCWFCFIPSLHKTSARPCLIIESKFAWKETMVTNNLICFKHIGASLHLAKKSNIVLVWRFQCFFLMCQIRKNKLLRRHLDEWKSMFPFFPKKGEETEGSKRQPSLAKEISAWPSRQPHRVRPRYLRQHRCRGSHLSWERIA